MNLTPLLVSALTGFLAALIAMPFQSLVANSKALKTLQEVYGATIKRLEKESTELRERVENLTKEVENWKSIRCERRNCKNRIPPINCDNDTGD